MKENNKQKVLIIGGGLVGSLCACYMAKRGCQVIVYEKRQDPRNTKELQGRSINLALSHRGRKALREIGLEEKILELGVPMYGRLLHSVNGKQTSVPYNTINNQCNYSVGRNMLNIELLEAAEKIFRVKVNFNHKLISSNINEGIVTIYNGDNSSTFEDTADLIIGADGAYSNLRGSIQQMPLFQFKQQYIDHGYIELNIPIEHNDNMIQNHLHIWPRKEFMMIALPNINLTWTVTLFMPFKQFELLDNEKKIKEFFHCTFADALPLIGENNIVEQFTKKKPSSLISIKCHPHHFGSRFLLIGDAAHAIVPFYGQGMNAGFEDCTILNNLLNSNNNNISRTLQEYTNIRVKSSYAIANLAMYNYLEMRDLCDRKSFKIRQSLDNLLFKLFPTTWIPLYTSVTYTSIDYDICLESKRWQDHVVQKILMFSAAVLIVFLAYTIK